MGDCGLSEAIPARADAFDHDNVHRAGDLRFQRTGHGPGEMTEE